MNGKKRDMTKAQFDAALKRYGIKRECFGYYKVTRATSCYAANGGNSRRSQLAYLIDRQDKMIREGQTK